MNLRTIEPSDYSTFELLNLRTTEPFSSLEQTQKLAAYHNNVFETETKSVTNGPESVQGLEPQRPEFEH